ncbi:MAG: cyclic nucleotide-binding domain-containing protein [Candidatus Dormiibacterota bacterium]|jgi:CRP/FNR family cyclic AMP-dependent transcriptional regulator
MPDADMSEVGGPEFLQTVPLFAGLSGRDLRNLAAATHDITYPAGTELTSLKDLPATFFIIVEGRANVTADGQVRTSMGPREWFGELALIGGGPRTAVVTAETEIRCLVLTRWEFRAFLQEHPDVSWILLETIAKRLSSA